MKKKVQKSSGTRSNSTQRSWIVTGVTIVLLLALGLMLYSPARTALFGKAVGAPLQLYTTEYAGNVQMKEGVPLFYYYGEDKPLFLGQSSFQVFKITLDSGFKPTVEYVWRSGKQIPQSFDATAPYFCTFPNEPNQYTGAQMQFDCSVNDCVGDVTKDKSCLKFSVVPGLKNRLRAEARYWDAEKANLLTPYQIAQKPDSVHSFVELKSSEKPEEVLKKGFQDAPNAYICNQGPFAGGVLRDVYSLVEKGKTITFDLLFIPLFRIYKEHESSKSELKDYESTICTGASNKAEQEKWCGAETKYAIISIGNPFFGRVGSALCFPLFAEVEEYKTEENPPGGVISSKTVITKQLEKNIWVECDAKNDGTLASGGNMPPVLPVGTIRENWDSAIISKDSSLKELDEEMNKKFGISDVLPQSKIINHLLCAVQPAVTIAFTKVSIPEHEAWFVCNPNKGKPLLDQGYQRTSGEKVTAGGKTYICNENGWAVEKAVPAEKVCPAGQVEVTSFILPEEKIGGVTDRVGCCKPDQCIRANLQCVDKETAFDGVHLCGKDNNFVKCVTETKEQVSDGKKFTCDGTKWVPIPSETDCTNMQDDDGDGWIDCEDSDCSNKDCKSGAACTYNPELLNKGTPEKQKELMENIKKGMVLFSCSCKEGYSEQQGTCLTSKTAVDTDGDGIADKDEPTGCQGKGKKDAVQKTGAQAGCPFGDKNGDGCLSAAEYNDFKQEYKKGLLNDVVPTKYNDIKQEYKNNINNIAC
ncbi:hypothetical protein HYX14_01245 [Candidatus Woesearchaeota archaeon]|nr:hypothetical protein [Candidatus Woesearchaeota archaeon]